MIGLKHRENLLVDYDEEWANLFLEEKESLLVALEGITDAIEHYGSTSVSGMPAKPIIDILVGVESTEDWIQCKLPLEALGYDYAENAGVPGHFIFGRGRDQTERTHLLHIVELDGGSWRSNLLFRDALRGDASLRDRYIAMKRQAVLLAPEGRGEYNQIKHGFIEDGKGLSAINSA
nr:putative integron gene cassette protein [uncultured bacterium]